ncbi:MAG: tetratricopeptide repeat protein [Gemmatimonadetes bacterium]|nr:tetratricopeptide repeat protein [Gemmatimonadota bacterium]
MAEKNGFGQLVGQVGGRSVWQVLVLYMGASWGVLEVVDVLKDNMGLPDWVFPFAVVLLLIGLPIMLGTAVIQARFAARAGGAAEPATSGDPLPASASAADEQVGDLAAHHFFTWRRALLGGAAAFVLLTVVTTGFMFMRNRGIGPVGSLVAKGLIDERSELLVADFEAEDDMLGRMAAEALRVDLSQSDIVRLVSPRTVEGALTRMQLPQGARLDEETAREIAEREGLSAVVGGEILSAGGSHVITAHLVTPAGDLLANARTTAADSSRIIGAIDEISRDLREQIGESYTSMRKSPALAQVSTSSLEALRKYTEAGVQRDEGNLDGAIALLEQAIEVDSTFAMAYRGLGIFLQNKFEDWSRQYWAYSKAYQYRDRLTEREKWAVAATYHLVVEDDPAAGIVAYENLFQIDPEAASAVNNIGVVYYFQRNWEKALEYYGRAHDMQPRGLTAANVGVVHANLGNLDEAAVWIDSARVLEPNAPDWLSWQVAFEQLRGDPAGARRLNTELRQSESADLYWETWTHTADWLLDAREGKVASGDAALAAAIDAAERRDSPAALDVNVLRALLDLSLGNPEGAVRRIETALERYPLDSIAPLDRPTAGLVSVLAGAGAVDEAREILATQRAELGPLADRARLGFESADASIAVAEGRYVDALPALRDADWGYGCQPCADHAVGRAFDLSGQPDSAAVYYEKYLTPAFNFRMWVDGVWKGWTMERLGQLYDEMGDLEQAAGYYGLFAELWADADPELQPRVRAARARMEEIARERG